ncbi:MAG: ABC transporter ATP-binding protein [Clostridia bacterium]|nr:ABC transporter ATP-binding protein [Clostridia bacterium]
MKREKQPNSLLRLLGYAGGHRKLTFLGCALSGVSAALSIAPYVFIWYIIRGVLVAMPDYAGATDLIDWGWLAVAFALTGAVIYFVALMCTHLAAFRTARNMRAAAATHLVDVPLGYFSANESGRLRKQIDDNAGMTETLLAHELPDAVGAIVTPLAAIALLFVFDWRMGLVSLIPIAIGGVLLNMMMGGKSAGFFGKYQIAIEDLSAEATEYVRGIPVVKVFQQTVRSFKSFYRSIMNYSKLATDYAMSCKLPMISFTTVLNSTFILLLPLGGALLSASSDGVGVLADIIFYILFTPFCAYMTNRLMYAGQAFMEADEAVRRLDQILSVQPLPEARSAGRMRDASVEFRDVTFTYPGASLPALKHVSFQAPAGATIALVGPSGGGKSTVASMIPRFWDAQEGQVRVGGTDVRQLSTDELMRHVAFVFQDARLFKASVLENIRAARPDATREQVRAAASAAQCDDILAKLPKGLDTVIGAKGVYLSGGEQQRIALARAILKDAPIVVLDEATAFADPENEVLIQRAFEALARGKTVVMIAHRLSTVVGADQILVLKDGEVVERGDHESLVGQNGLYRRMWRDYQTAALWKVGKEERA